nr:hypothetical protein [Tanacetum cinerariifolium]
MTGNKEKLDDFVHVKGGTVTFGGGDDIQPEQHINCLLAKASLEESTKWHRRMAHVNFKTINKMAKQGLVDGLPLKLFTHEHNCISCNKGKQHKASYNAISVVRTISEPLQLLHMDLFGPTSIRSIDHKYYSLVVTDDFKFRNAKVIALYGEKGIKRDYSNARTSQQNGVAEQKNRTLIEAARSMLADSKLPTMFWTEAVSTALTILNTSDHLGKFEGKANDGFLIGYAAYSKAYRVYNLSSKKVEETLNLRYLEDKPNVQGLGQEWYFDLDYLTDSLGYTHFKTNPPTCTHDTNILAGTQADDSDSKCDEQVILVPSFPSSSFLGATVHDVSAPIENNLDYAEELARLQRQEYEAHSAVAKHGFEFSDNTAALLYQATIKIRRNLVLAAGDPASSIVSTGGVPADSVPASGVPAGSLPASVVPAGSVPASGVPAGSLPASSVLAGGVLTKSIDSVEFGVPTASESVPAVFTNDPAATSPLPPSHSLGSYEYTTRFPSPSDLGNHQPTAGIFSSSSYDDDFCADVTNLASNVTVDPVATKRDPDWVAAMQEDMQQFYHQQVWKLVPLPAGKIAIGTKWILKNKRDDRRIMVRNKARLVVQGHRQEEGIDYDDVFALEIEKDVYVTQPKGFEDPHNPKHVYRVVKALYGLHQAPRAWFIWMTSSLAPRIKPGVMSLRC